MTESKNINYQYQKIITELQLLNPNINLDEIKIDVEELLLSLFINEIENLKFTKDISYEKLRKDVIKQSLQSFRQTINLREFKDTRIEKERKYLKLKQLQNGLKRKAFYDSINYPGTYSKKELFYINHTDKTFLKSKFSKNLNKYENQEIIPGLTEENESSLYKKEKTYDFDENNVKSTFNFPEIQETIDVFKKIEENEGKHKEEETLKIELEMDLRKRILNLNLKPIEKKDSKDLNLLDYIGFVDKNDNSTKND